MGQLPSQYGVIKQVIDPGFQWAEIGWKQPPGCDGLAPTSRVASSDAPHHPPLNCGNGATSYSGEDGYASMADVLVFDKGQFDPSLMKNATPIDVDGAPGLAADVTPINDTVKWTVASVMDPSKPPKVATIAWQYAPDRWAVVAWRNATDTGARETALRIARATRIGQTHPALVPFKIDYLPAAVDRRWSLTFSGPGTSNVGFGNTASTYWPGFHFRTPDRALPISVASAALNGPRRIPQKGDVSVTVAGQAAIYSPKLSTLFVSCGATCTLLVGYGALGSHLAGSMSEAELIKVAEHITMAPSLSDTSTWFDAAYALPH
jgi:hypothetical protein